MPPGFILTIAALQTLGARPLREVHATTKEELDAALATADQIVVEGDDELLSYAVNKAAGDPENRVTIDSTDRYVGGGSIFRPNDIVEVEDPEFVTRLLTPEEQRKLKKVHLAAELRRLADEAQRRIGKKFRRPSLVIIAAAPVAILAIITGAAIWLFIGKHEPLLQPGIVPRPEKAPPSFPSLPAEAASNVPAVLQTVAWPLVAIVAIVALSLIAWKAISSGRNVTIVWKVTEKVSGKVVITKVRERAPRRQAA